MTLDLLCLGNLTIDDIVLPDGTTRMGCFGGDAIYGAIGASYWSGTVQFVAPVGVDFPPEHIQLLKEMGWNTTGLARREIPNIRNWVVYEYDGRRTWILRSDPADFLELSPNLEDIPAGFREAKAGLVLAMDLAAQEGLVPLLKGLGMMVALDPQEDYIFGNQERIFKLLAGVDIFTPSEEEVHRLLGHNDYPRAAREFAGYGPKIVIVKKGGGGSLIFDSRSQCQWELPVYPVPVKDTTGAGDAYCGGFMAMYLMSGDILKSGLAGTVSASFAVEDFGINHMLTVDRQVARQRLNHLSAQIELNAVEGENDS